MSGERFDAKKAWGAAVNGAVTDAVQGGLIGSGAGIPVALAANFAAGTAGSAAEQYIGTGKVSARKSVTSGLTNAVSNLIYGTNPLGSAKEAFARGFGAGAATSGINYLSDFLGNRQSVTGGVDAGGTSGITRGAVSPYGMQRDPRRGCGSVSPFTTSIGYSSAKGYQYSVPETGNVSQSQQKGFSLKDFAVQTIMGGVIGGVTSAAFYGAGKGIEKLKESFRANRDSTRVRYRRGEPVVATKKTLEMALDPEAYASAIADKYGINLRGSGQDITIKFNSKIPRGTYGRTVAVNPNVIEFGPDALMSEAELANTIAHELNHARDFLRGGKAEEGPAYKAGNALVDYIFGGR